MTPVSCPQGDRGAEDVWLHQEQSYYTLSMTIVLPDNQNDTVPYIHTKH